MRPGAALAHGTSPGGEREAADLVVRRDDDRLRDPGRCHGGPDRRVRQARHEVAPLLRVEDGAEPRLRPVQRADRDDGVDRERWVTGPSRAARADGTRRSRRTGRTSPARRARPASPPMIVSVTMGRQAERLDGRGEVRIDGVEHECRRDVARTAARRPGRSTRGRARSSIRSAGPLSALPPMIPLTAMTGTPRSRAPASASRDPGHAPGSARSRRSGWTGR